MKRRNISVRRGFNRLLSTALAGIMIFSVNVAAKTTPVKRSAVGEELTSYNDSLLTFNSTYSVDDMKVTLKDGNYERWVDRITLPDFGIDFYNGMEEGCDGDGVDDWLIDYDGALKSKYYNSNSENYYYTVVEISGTADTQEEMEAEITGIFSAANGVIMNAYGAFDRDHPEVFWLTAGTATSLSYSYSYMDNNGVFEDFEYDAVISLTLKNEWYDIRINGYRSAENIQKGIKEVKTSVSDIVKGVASGASDAEKVRYFNKWLTANNGYCTGTTQGYLSAECLSALRGTHGVNGPVCEGYSRAMMLMCQAVGIPCVLATGVAKSGPNATPEGHMWNNIKIGEKWYSVDSTWNDPIVSGKDGNGTEEYFLVGSETVIGSMKFGVSHPEENYCFDEGIDFTNGPVIEKNEWTACVGGHTPGEAATCTEPQKCTVCGVVLVSAKSHTPGVAATCTEPQICTECKEILVPAKGHTPEGKADCTKDVICSVCKTVITEAKGHSFSTEWTVDKAATYTEQGEKSRHCLNCDARTDVTAIPVLTEINFKDVKSGAWFYDAVKYAVTNGLFNGMTATTFEPNTVMSRAMLVTVLWRMEGSPEVPVSNKFTDLKQSWYKVSVSWAAQNGIVNGTSATTFSPEKGITREQMAAMIYNYSLYKKYDVSKTTSLKSFPDNSKVSSYATTALSWAVGEGFITGNGKNLDPKGNASRAQVATILMRFRGKYSK